MSTSGGTTGSRSRHGRDNDTYEPEQQGVRNIAAKDGYDAGDGFERPIPQLFPNVATASQSSYLPSGSTTYDSARRRSSTGAFDDYEYRRRQNSGYGDGYKYGYGSGGFGREYTTPRRNRSAPRGREYVPNDYSDSESDYDDYDDERDRALAKRRASHGRASSRGRSQSNGGGGGGLREKIKDMLEGDEEEMGSGNSQAKKWAATALGAVAGGFAARTAKKDAANNWVPTALGAFIGGLTAREAEKVFYLRKDSKEKEQQQWEGRRGRD